MASKYKEWQLKTAMKDYYKSRPARYQRIIGNRYKKGGGSKDLCKWYILHTRRMAIKVGLSTDKWVGL